MRKCLPFILMVLPYLFTLFVILPDSLNENIYILLLLAYAILTIIVYTLNIINAITYKGEDAIIKLASYNMIIKLVHIPFYLCVFIIGIVFIVAMVVPALVFISPFIVFTLFLIDCFLMLTSSAYGISSVIKSSKNGLISKKVALVNIIFHCVFIADVISAIFLYREIRRKKIDLPIIN